MLAWILAGAHIFTALLVIAVCVPLYRGQVKRNAFYGMRTRKALESDESWLAINRYGAGRMFLWSAILIALALLGAMLLGDDSPRGYHIAFAFAPLIYLAPCDEIIRFGRRF